MGITNANMGLLPGVNLNVLHAGPGASMVLVRGTRLAIGHGIAQKMKVKYQISRLKAI